MEPVIVVFYDNFFVPTDSCCKSCIVVASDDIGIILNHVRGKIML